METQQIYDMVNLSPEEILQLNTLEELVKLTHQLNDVGTGTSEVKTAIRERANQLINIMVDTVTEQNILNYKYEIGKLSTTTILTGSDIDGSMNRLDHKLNNK